jgi:hypothetical protein
MPAFFWLVDAAATTSRFMSLGFNQVLVETLHSLASPADRFFHT